MTDWHYTATLALLSCGWLEIVWGVCIFFFADDHPFNIFPHWLRKGVNKWDSTCWMCCNPVVAVVLNFVPANPRTMILSNCAIDLGKEVMPVSVRLWSFCFDEHCPNTNMTPDALWSQTVFALFVLSNQVWQGIGMCSYQNWNTLYVWVIWPHTSICSAPWLPFPFSLSVWQVALIAWWLYLCYAVTLPEMAVYIQLHWHPVYQMDFFQKDICCRYIFCQITLCMVCECQAE